MNEEYKVITKFGGCDIILRSKKDRRVLAELFAVQWQEAAYPNSEERWVKQGQFVIDEILEPPLAEEIEIEITMMTEDGTRRIEFKFVTVFIEPSEQQEDEPALMRFDAHVVSYSDYIDGHWQLSFF